MTGHLAQIFRHPIKSIGRQEVAEVVLKAGEILPWDRAFAVAHANARATDLAQSWAKKANYLRGASGPSLMAVEASFDPETKALCLTHPDVGPLNISISTPDGHAALVEWLATIWPVDAPRPTQVIHHPGHAQTDVPDAWISLHSYASHRQVAAALNSPGLSIHRWRGNLWLDDVPAWAEHDWVGREIQIGDTVFHVHQPITRCKATMANPVTGQRDLDTLKALNTNWGHTDFGVYASVIKGGHLSKGAPVKVL